MDFKWHILFGFVISYILVYFFNFTIFAGLIIFLSSWLIDGDHYLWYAFEMKDWNPFHGIKWYLNSIPTWFKLPLKEREKFKRGVFIFHGILFWLILGALSFLHPIFLWVLIGVAIHMAADLPDLIIRGEPLYNKIFPCYVIKRNKNKKGLKDL
jgi:hypothetical protein